MSDEEENSESSEGQSKLERNLGKIILWGVISLVGWSFYSTMKHQTALAVQAEQIQNIRKDIDIDKRLSSIEAQLSAHSKLTSSGP